MNEPRLLLPALDAEPWPSLGEGVCDFIEQRLVHGPGDVLGNRPTLTDEERFFIFRCYEVFPHGHERAGRRRFKRAVYSRRKGSRKSELAAWLAIVEFDPEGPVRTVDWVKDGKVWLPVGGPVRDPYIPMVATTEEQTEDLVYGAVKAILENCDLGNGYVIGRERIMHLNAPGVMKALAGAPNARDGARTSHQSFDETCLWISTRLREAHQTMLRNMAKRKLADPWSLETTTQYGPGEDSIAEDSHLYAEKIMAGLVDDPQLLFDHRQASETHDLDTKKGLLAAITEGSGDALEWADVDAIAAQWREAAANRDEHGKNKFRRFWLNQRRSLVRRSYPIDLWNSRADDKRKVAEKVRIVLSFDGSYARDSTALLGTTVEETPHIFVIKAWEKPPHDPRWRTPVLEVEAEVEEAMETYEVVEFAPDPPGWKHEVEAWELKYGEVVVRFETNQPARMGPACDAFDQAMRGDEDTHEGGFTHDGDERLTRHISHCVTVKRGRYQLVTKEHPDSPLKIDLAVGAIVGFDRATWHHVNEVPAGDPGWAFV